MKLHFLLFLIILSCSHSSIKDTNHFTESDIVKTQKVWDSKNPEEAKKVFPDIQKLVDKKDSYTLGIGPAGLPTFGIFVSKKENKITNVMRWL